MVSFHTLFFFSSETNKQIQCVHLLYYDFTQDENVHIHCLPSPAASIRRSTRRTKLSPFMSGYKKLSDAVVDRLMLHLYSFKTTGEESIVPGPHHNNKYR